MSKERVLGIIRHTLTFVGGLLVMNGFMDEGMSSELIGGVMTLVGAIWSVVEKN